MAQPSPHKHPTSPSASSLNAPAFPSSANPDFIPRKEFIKGHRVTSTFALLTLSGSSLVRLYRFPPPVVTALQGLFDQSNLIQGGRQDEPKHFSEFSLAGRPWATPKSYKAERLIIDILTIILHHGFILMSSLDYGREQDDHLAISFSKPMLISTGPTSTTALTNGSTISLNVPIRTPFAVSFLSATRLRVISPPLSNTPGVLQSVRGAWRTGVRDEGKVGDNSYEFNFNGYKWYQEDTFAADSLHLILKLLESLDAHGFSLLTSFTLSKRSKTKDFWVFTNSGDDAQPANPGTTTNSPAGSNQELMRELSPHEGNKFATISNGRALPIASGTLNNLHHTRSFSDTTPITSSPLKGTSFSFAKASNIFRLPSSSKNPQPIPTVPEVPASTVTSPEQSPLMGASSIGSCDMTGIGAGPRASTLEPMRVPDIVVTTSQMKPMQSDGHNPLERAFDSPYPVFPARSMSGRLDSNARISTTPLDASTYISSPFLSSEPKMSNGDSSPHNDNGYIEGHKSTSAVPPQTHLLAPAAFRDSAFSSQTGSSIPITWTGKHPELDQIRNVINTSSGGEADSNVAGQQHVHHSDHDRSAPHTGVRHTPQRDSERNDVYRITFPTIKEQPSKEGDIAQAIHLAMSLTKEDSPPSKQDLRTAASPRTMNVTAVEGVRQSERPDIVNGDVKNRSPPREKREKKQKPATERLDSGWVMVNVEGSKKSPGHGSPPNSARSRTQSPPSSRPSAHTRGSSDSQIPRSRTRSPKTPPAGQASMSAATKTIAMIDAMDAKEQKEKAKANSPFKRFLGRAAGSNDADKSRSPPAGGPKRKIPEGTVSKMTASEAEQAEEWRGRGREIPSVRQRDRRVDID